MWEMGCRSTFFLARETGARLSGEGGGGENLEGLDFWEGRNFWGGGELNDFRGICLETIVAGILLVFFAL